MCGYKGISMDRGVGGGNEKKKNYLHLRNFRVGTLGYISPQKMPPNYMGMAQLITKSIWL